MAKTLIRALIVGAFALTVWQVGGSGGDRTVFAADLDCDDFTSQAAAQAHYDADTTDPDGLDSDDDGTACENFDYDEEYHNDCNVLVNYPTCYSQPDNYYGCNNPYYNGAPYTGAPIYYYGPPGNPYYNGAPANPYSGQPNYAGNPYQYGYPYNSANPYNGNPNYYNQCQDGLNHSPGFNRGVALTLLVQNTTISCGAETLVSARVVYPDGVGVPNRIVSFQSSTGTVFTNLLTDYAGYVQTKFVAPLSPGLVRIDATADGLRQSVQVKVECTPTAPPLGVTYISPVQTVISPPSTGDAGLAEAAGNSAPWALIAALIVLGMPATALAVARIRK